MRRKALFIVILVFLLISWSVFYWFHREKTAVEAIQKDYNIILIAVTNIGAKHMGLYGYHRDTTPRIDAFANESVVFEQFYSPASWTLPSGASLFTGLYPYAHGVMNRQWAKHRQIIDILSERVITLIDLMKRHGYYTIALTGGFDYRPEFGVTNRFDKFIRSDKDPLLDEMIDVHFRENRWLGSIVDNLRGAQMWLSENKGQKFFMFLQGYDTHCPFLPAGDFNEYFVDFDASEVSVKDNYCYRGVWQGDTILTYRMTSEADVLRKEMSSQKMQLTAQDLQYLEAQYDGEVRYTDHHVGKFLDFLQQQGFLNNTIIIILSEHGEMFAKHGRFGRAGAVRGTLYDEVVHVPLIIHHPQLKSARIKDLTQITDVMPTIMDFVGLKVPLFQRIHGKSLLPLMTGDRLSRKYIYGGSLYIDPYNRITINEYVRSGEHKLIGEQEYVLDREKFHTSGASYELYHIPTDPDEKDNLTQSRPEVAQQLKGELIHWSNPWKKFLNSRFKKWIIKQNKWTARKKRKQMEGEDISTIPEDVFMDDHLGGAD
jgi:arylsulfatase A-like enzyme